MRLTTIILLLILICGGLLRLYKLNDTVMFYEDEAYNSLQIRNMLVTPFNQIIKYYDNFLKGPITHIHGLKLGPFYYYLMSPFFYLFKFNPIAGSYVTIALDILAIYIIYLISTKIIGTATGLIAAFCYAIAAIPALDARNMWNPNLLPFFNVLIVYLLLLILTNRKQKCLWLLGFITGLYIQLHLTAFFIFPILLAVFIIYKIKPTIKNAVISIIFFILAILPILINDGRHIIRGRLKLASFYSIIEYLTSFKQVENNAIAGEPYIISLIKNIVLILFGINNSYVYFLFALFVIAVIYYIKAVIASKQLTAMNYKSGWIILIFFSVFILCLPAAAGNKSLYLFKSVFPFIFIIWAAAIVALKASIQSYKPSKYLVCSILILFAILHLFVFKTGIDGIITRAKPPHGLTLNNKIEIVNYIIADSGNNSFIYDEIPASPYALYSFDYLFLIKNKLPCNIYELKPYNFVDLKVYSKSGINKENLMPQNYLRYLVYFPFPDTLRITDEFKEQNYTLLKKIGAAYIFKKL